jgi:hypothetical protein
MRSPEIKKLIDAVEVAHGTIKLYTPEPSDGHGTCFTVDGVAATFSVNTQDGSLPSDQYSIQIEGIPPGDYLYTAIVSLSTFLELMSLVSGPEDQWPLNWQ